MDRESKILTSWYGSKTNQVGSPDAVDTELKPGRVATALSNVLRTGTSRSETKLPSKPLNGSARDI